MSKNKTGGPAFPWTADRADRGDVPGMTLRDYFAAKAMREMDWSSGEYESCAAECYKFADAMLEAREAE